MKPSLKKILFSLVLSIGLLYSSGSMAQCSVCASNVSSAVKSNQTKAGLGINNGIFLLLVMPYTIVGIVGVVYYINSRKKKKIILGSQTGIYPS